MNLDLKVDPKTADLETLQNFDVIEKVDAVFGISDPKLIKFGLFRTKYIIAVDRCNKSIYNKTY